MGVPRPWCLGFGVNGTNPGPKGTEFDTLNCTRVLLRFPTNRSIQLHFHPSHLPFILVVFLTTVQEISLVGYVTLLKNEVVLDDITVTHGGFFSIL